MDGVAVIVELLLADSRVTDLVPADRIVGDHLPLGTPLSAISVERISSVDRNILSPGATRRVTERVQVTALAATKPQMKAILRAARGAAADYVGSAAGLDDVTVHTDSAGPDFRDEQASIHMGSQDFKVGFTEPR